MKKLFFFIATASLALTSCSGDDSSSNGGNSGADSVKFTVDGTSKNYQTVTVSEETSSEGTYLTVTASNGGAQEFITFYVEQGDLGSDAAYGANYFAAGDSFYGNSPEFNILVETNTESKLKGTFSGVMQINSGGIATKSITNGTFNISY